MKFPPTRPVHRWLAAIIVLAFTTSTAIAILIALGMDDTAANVMFALIVAVALSVLVIRLWLQVTLSLELISWIGSLLRRGVNRLANRRL